MGGPRSPHFDQYQAWNWGPHGWATASPWQRVRRLFSRRGGDGGKVNVAITEEGGRPSYRPFRPLPLLKAAETGHVIRQAIAATAESCCDGAVAAALFLCGRAALWAGAESVFAEELDQNLYLCLLVIRLVFVSYSAFCIIIRVSYHIRPFV